MAIGLSNFRLLDLAYGMSCFSDRLWTFALVFVLQRLGGIRLVGINQLIEGLSSMLLSPSVGGWLDKKDRLNGVLTVLLVNNGCVALSAILLVICLSVLDLERGITKEGLNYEILIYYAALGLSIVLCALSKCASDGEKMVFTKDWIIVLSQADHPQKLSTHNARLTTIDQLAQLLAPLMTGYLLLFGGYMTTCFVIVIWNIVSWMVERYFLRRTYTQVKELAVRIIQLKNSKDSANLPSLQAPTSCERILAVLKNYTAQKVFPAAFGLALLYMTVLGFDGLVISYGKSQNLPDDLLGILRSAASLMGICGAVFYAFTERSLGVRKTGFVALSIQCFFTMFCVVSIWLPGSPFDLDALTSNWLTTSKSINFTVEHVDKHLIDQSISPSTKNVGDCSFTLSILFLFGGITFARIGLWMADLSITQIMQQSIPEENRNTTFGTQNAICKLFSMLKDIAAILLPDPRTFGLLILMSMIFVMLGYLHYCYFLIKTTKKKVFKDDLKPKNTDTKPTKHVA